MSSIEKYVFLQYRPRVTWLYPIYNRLNSTTSSVLKARWSDIPVELSELGLAVATKLALLLTTVGRFNGDYAKLLEKAKQDAQHISEHVRTNTVWDVPDSERLPFDLIAELEAFIFEARSTYEILGKFLTTLFRIVFERKINEKDLKEVLRNEGLDVAWARLLQDERKLFFHDTAPWLALAITDSHDSPYELLVVRRNVAELTNPNDYARLSEYNDIYAGLAKALNAFQRYAISEIDRFEK